MHPGLIEVIIICTIIEIFKWLVEVVKWMADGVVAGWNWILGIFDTIWSGGACVLDCLQAGWEWVISIIPW